MRKYKVVNGRVIYAEDDRKSLDQEADQPGNRKKTGYNAFTRKVSQRVLSAVAFAEEKSKRRTTTQITDKRLFNAATGGYDNICNGTFGQITLRVRKGKHIFEFHYCADCKELTNPIWRYRESNYGMIYLCNICKTLAFERSFGHADAMPLKIDHAHAHKGKWK